MSLKNQTQTSSVPLETVYELEKCEDGSTRIGNSVEVSAADAVQMIKAGLAKHELAPIGEVPSHLIGGRIKAEVSDVGNSN